MKKIIFLIFWLAAAVSYQTQAQYNFPSQTGWDFTIERIFNGEDNRIPKYQDDINIRLINFENNEDLRLVLNIVEELRSLIPNKIAVSSEGHGNLILELVPKNSGIRFFSSRNLHHHKMLSQHNKICLENLTPTEKKRIIEYMIVRSLCVLQNNNYNSFIGNAILDYKDQTDPLSTNFTEADKFLLHNLYAPDFSDKAKKYITDKHSWRYYMNFVYRNEVKWFSIILCTLIVILIFTISYKTILTKKFKKPYFNYLFPGLLIIYTTLIILEVYHHTTSMEVDAKPAYLAPIVYNLSWLAPVSILYLLERYYIKSKQTISKQLKLKAFFTFSILSITIIPFMVFINKPRIRLMLTLVAILIFFSRMLFLYLREHSAATIREKDAELSKLKELKAQAEVASLHARINPHFLYNSLNSIASLAHNNPDKTEQMALSLSDLFRHNLNRKNEATSSIKDEIEALKAYLKIEQIRFGERMTFTIEIEKDLEHYQIPRNIIQPLVENAIKHGISKILEKGFIKVDINKAQNNIIIAVTDNGPRFPDGLVSGYGLQSIHDILKLSYGDKASLSWENQPTKTIVITIEDHE